MIQTRPREHVQPSKVWKLVKKQTQDLNSKGWLWSYCWHCDIYRSFMGKHSTMANRNGEGESTRAIGRNHIILWDKENSLEEYRAHRPGGAYKARVRSWAQRITMQSGNGWLHPSLAWAACFCCEEFHLQIPASPLGHLFKDKSHEGWPNITHLLYQGEEWESPPCCGQRWHYVPSTISHPHSHQYCRGNEVENNLLPKGLLGIIPHARPCMMGCL